MQIALAPFAGRIARLALRVAAPDSVSVRSAVLHGSAPAETPPIPRPSGTPDRPPNVVVYLIDHIVRLPERTHYLRGLRAWLGFRQIGVEYHRDPRAGGSSKYDWRALLQLAGDGIFAFSDAPVRLLRNLGMVLTVSGSLLGLSACVARLIDGQAISGLTLLALLVVFLGGVQVLGLGILGEYLARTYGEVRGRPRYVIRECHGVEPTIVERRSAVMAG